VESKRLLTDSGGPGQWRGGLGQEVVMRNDTDHPLTMLGMGNRTEFPARGQFGGGAGTLRLHAVDGKPVHAKGRIEVAPGQRITLIEAGGGGYGEPANRDPRSIADDVADRLVSTEAARKTYGWRG
jgi:N-methylhydantoinase B